MKRGFISDNCAAVHPDIIQALLRINGEGHAPSYGDDKACARAQKTFAALFEKPFPVSFVFNGTGANVLSLACCLKPYESVICADCAHIYADETGAPERVLGCKLQALPSSDGKITPDQVVPLLLAQGNPHHAQPRALSITNVTEWGAVYTPEEIRMLSSFAHANNLLVHMDGARIANAAVACGCSVSDLTWKAGVDVLSYGGCKNGLMFGEAVLFFNTALAASAAYLRKNITQLHSKMRYIGAQYEALLSNDLWRGNAAHANAMAQKIEAALRKNPAIRIVHPAQANMLFVEMPRALADKVCAEGYGSSLGGLIRLVASWDTQDAEIEALSALTSP